MRGAKTEPPLPPPVTFVLPQTERVEREIRELLAAGVGVPDSPDAVRALDLHKERIRRLQEALCECQHRDFFQADLHDELCPVYVIAEKQRREYEPRV